MMGRRAWAFLVLCLVLMEGCQLQKSSEVPAGGLTAADKAAVEESVRGFMGAVAQDVTRDGPAAWGKEFSREPEFFMAVNGAMAFASGEAAAQALPGVAQMIPKIELQWGKDLRVDPLTADLAVVGTSWQEVLSDPQGKTRQDNGYFTGVVQRRNGKWEFRDAHWSSAPAAAKAP
jgi:hypothetical protein